MGKHIGTGGLARGKTLGWLAFYTWVQLVVTSSSYAELGTAQLQVLLMFQVMLYLPDMHGNSNTRHFCILCTFRL